MGMDQRQLLLKEKGGQFLFQLSHLNQTAERPVVILPLQPAGSQVVPHHLPGMVVHAPGQGDRPAVILLPQSHIAAADIPRTQQKGAPHQQI